ncbi:hypothetical protein [Sutcliffiella cohnii]|uniref:hypothetical protein n=1 Tax=Sutcliffiella cohnii TaxID=33932 RepID=UPI002E21474A|nr:hypothetical protein [Sutcliffiella cohnii]
MALKTSVNIKFDVGNDEFVRRYIPSPSHTEALKGILNGFNNNGNSSHIIIGPYGTGKSLLATVVSSIVSNLTARQEIQTLINKFQHYDDYIAEQIAIVSNLEREYVPVLLTGNEGRFREAILTNIIKTLKHKKNIDIILPGISEKILDSIKTWEMNFPNTYKQFISHLNSQGKDIDKWLTEVKKQNEEEIIFFSEIYPLLTSGANFDVGYNNDFISQMEFLSKKLEEENIGIFIVFDEFGRFLQGLDSPKLNEAMQDIQDLAEIVTRSDSFHLMLITHKSFRQYFKGNNNDVSKEFQRIEKRFSQYHITSDQLTFLKLAEVILTENISNKPLINNEQFISTFNKMKKFSLFPSLNPTDREEKIVRAMYPLHPVSLFLLPKLSGVLGQNERTLFTFLESEETGGLKNHMYKFKDYYKSYQLFDYFFPDLNDIDLGTEIREQLLIHKKAMARIPDDIKNRELAINTLKIITLWNICGLQNEQKISNEFLSFALEVDEKELIFSTQKLSDHKVIRFHRVNNCWEFHSGSTINIEAKIEKSKNKLKLKQRDILSIFNKNLSKKYFFPEEYNDEKEMTRFAKIEIVLGDEVSKLNVEVVNKSDVVILYIIPREIDDIKKIKHQLSKLDLQKNVLCAIHPVPLNSIEDAIKEVVVLHDLLNDSVLLSEDKGIKEELNLITFEINHIIKEYLSYLTEFNEQVIWLNNKAEMRVNNSIELSELLSSICFELYNYTPMILNDSFNRINISSVQKKAAISVVNRILSSPREEKFGIEGNGPDYAIYASIFKRNGNFCENINELDYSEIKNESYKLIREKLINLLENNPKGSLKDIINIFFESPFGIRKPVIPILLVGMLRDRWNEFMLYRNDMYISGLNGDTLFEILYEEGPENYHYVYEKFDDKYIEFFNYIEESFEDYIEERLEGKSRLIQTCGTLLKWLRSLPRITQLTDSVENELILFRDYIRQTEVKPQESIAKIYSTFYKENSDELIRIKAYAERFVDIFKDNLLTSVFEKFNVTSFDAIREWSLSRHEFLKKNNKLVKVFIKIDKDDWFDEFIEEYMGVQVIDWSDTTRNLFFNQLEIDFLEANAIFENIKDESKEEFFYLEVDGQKKVISKVDFSVKTSTIYNNVNRMIKNAGRSVPKKEIEYMIYRLFEEYVE